MKNFRMLAVRAMLLTGIALGSVFYSCQSEDVDFHPEASRDGFTIKSNEPVVMTFQAAAQLISMNDTADCFTVQVNIIAYIPGHGYMNWMSYVAVGGTNCPDLISSPGAPGGGGVINIPGGGKSVSRYMYQGEYFEDQEIGGSKASDLFDKYPDAYTEYQRAKIEALTKAGY